MHVETQPRSLPYSKRDVEAALPDYLSIRLGAVKPADADPIGAELARRDFKLWDVAVHLDPMLARQEGRASRALGTSDFGVLLGTALAAPVVARYDEAVEELNRFVYDLPVRSFRPVQLAQVDVGDAFDEISEGGELLHPAPVTTTTQSTAQLGAWGANLVISRQAIVNDDLGVIEGLVAQVGQHCARLEYQQLAELLNTNGNLADSAALFTGTNDVAGGVSVTGLDNASGGLRQQVGGGNAYANHRLGAVLVPPGKEITARTLAGALYGGPGSELYVAANAWLGASYYYAFSTPPVAIARLVLQGSTGKPLADPLRLNLPIDGVAVRVRHDFRIVAAQRVGVVRVAV